ncbi:hypothetical protein WJX84_004213 [Apatococcus fuscideae]|uniref:Acyl carrier protein n=1 Tax=Apatococcus fuscideae TaxID=2026836 RepID=A0AAW1TEL8_9CHLO
MVLAGVISSVSRGVLSRIRVPVNLQQSGGQVVAAAGSFSIWRSFAKGTYLDKGDVTERVLNVVKHFEKVDENKVNPNVNFQRDLGLDSLDTVEVVMAFEEEFGVEIPDAEAEKILSTNEAIEYIASHPQAK